MRSLAAEETPGGESLPEVTYIKGPYYTNRAARRSEGRTEGFERRKKMKLREWFERKVQRETKKNFVLHQRKKI
jgi:hypothetical protein